MDLVEGLQHGIHSDTARLYTSRSSFEVSQKHVDNRSWMAGGDIFLRSSNCPNAVVAAVVGDPATQRASRKASWCFCSSRAAYWLVLGYARVSAVHLQKEDEAGGRTTTHLRPLPIPLPR